MCKGQDTRGTLSAELRHRFDMKMQAEPSAVPLFTGATEDAVRLLHELQVKQVELEQQNAELRLLSDGLEERVAERTASLSRALEQRRLLARELLKAEERERERIAGELHDQVGQSLLLVKLNLERAAGLLPPESLPTAIGEAVSLLATCLHDLRTLSFSLRLPVPENVGIGAALEWLCSSIQSGYGLQIDVSRSDHPMQLPEENRYPLCQAVRELLLNVVKHARSKRARLSLQADDQSLVVKVIDEGIGFDYAKVLERSPHQLSYGLHHVRHRVELSGGRLDIDSAPGRGTTATVKMPLIVDNPGPGG